MKTGAEYANWEQYGSEKGGGNPLIAMLIQKTGLEDYLNPVGMTAASGQLAPLKPVAPPAVAPMSPAPVPPVRPQAMANVQVNPIPERPAITAHPLYPNGYPILKGL